MKKYSSILLLLLFIFLLCSCGEGSGKMIKFDDSNKKADARMEQVIEVIKNKDRNAFREMFSKRALSDSVDFYEKLDALFDYIQGDILSWERTGTYGGTDEKNVDGTGNRKKETQSIYVFITDEQEYEIAIYEFTIDTANSDNVGVYSICVINKNDKQNPEIRYWGNGDAGINIG